ncbi:MAG: hypothetical protein OHK0021_09240 [Bryobacter sp.]
MKSALRIALIVAVAIYLAAQFREEKLSDWELEATFPIAEDLHHVQGIDVEGDQLWVSAVDRKTAKGFLYRIQLPSGKVQASVEVQDGAKYHPGGLQLDGDSLWVPVAEYDRDGPANIERRNKQTLALEQRFTVNDHIGCVAASQDKIIGGSWSSRTVYTWSKEGKLLDQRPNPLPTAWQDLKMDGALLMGSGGLSRTEGAIDWVRLPDLTLVRQVRTGKTDRNVIFTNEGMTLREGHLYLLPEDAPSRLFRFAAHE